MFDSIGSTLFKRCKQLHNVTILAVLLMVTVMPASANDLVIEENFIERNNEKIYARQICPGKNIEKYPQLVFSHGLTYSSHEFDVNVKDYSLARYFAKAGYCVWLFDVTGYGQSSRPADGFMVDSDYAAADLKAVVEHVVKRSKTEKVSLFGWSWGTVVASRFAVKQPELVKKLVLFAPIYKRLGGSAPVEAWHQNTWQHAAGDFQTESNGLIDFNLVEKAVAHTFLSNCWRFDGDSSPNGGRRDLLGSNGRPLFAMKEITNPVMLIGGSKDPLLDWPKLREGFAYIAKRPGNQLVEIKGGSHILMLEKPYYQTFREQILSFLKQTG